MLATPRLVLPVALLAAVVACWLAFGHPVEAQEKAKAAAAKWEYRVKTFEAKDNESFEKELNKAGEEGWELGGVVSRVDGGNSGLPRLVFKRAKP